MSQEKTSSKHLDALKKDIETAVQNYLEENQNHHIPEWLKENIKQDIDESLTEINQVISLLTNAASSLPKIEGQQLFDIIRSINGIKIAIQEQFAS